MRRNINGDISDMFIATVLATAAGLIEKDMSIDTLKWAICDELYYTLALEQDAVMEIISEYWDVIVTWNG